MAMRCQWRCPIWRSPRAARATPMGVGGATCCGRSGRRRNWCNRPRVLGWGGFTREKRGPKTHGGGGSHVLRAIGAPAELVQSATRFGLGRFTTAEEVAYAAGRVVEAVRRLREQRPV